MSIKDRRLSSSGSNKRPNYHAVGMKFASHTGRPLFLLRSLSLSKYSLGPGTLTRLRKELATLICNAIGLVK